MITLLISNEQAYSNKLQHSNSMRYSAILTYERASKVLQRSTLRLKASCLVTALPLQNDMMYTNKATHSIHSTTVSVAYLVAVR
jgi:hypothetical protein